LKSFGRSDMVAAILIDLFSMTKWPDGRLFSVKQQGCFLPFFAFLLCRSCCLLAALRRFHAFWLIKELLNLHCSVTTPRPSSIIWEVLLTCMSMWISFLIYTDAKLERPLLHLVYVHM
jgi:hypothetical protein